jgi:four helix bundle protein
MFLTLAHTKLDVYQASRRLAPDCYKVTKQFPSDKRFCMVQQVRRAALSVHLNLAEGCSRRSSAERRRYFEVSKGSVVEIDTCFDLAVELKYVNFDDLQSTGESIVKTFKMLCGMMDKQDTST